MAEKRWEDYDEVQVGNEIINMNKVIEDVHRAQAAAVHLNPAIGSLIGKLQKVYTFRLKTWATDGVNLFINPYFTSKLSPTEHVFLMYHEVLHNLLNHMRRAKARGDDHFKANIAGDYECNITISDMGMVRYDTIKNMKAFIDKKFSGKGYESIYDELKATGGFPSEGQTGNMQGDDGSTPKQGQPGQQGPSGSGNSKGGKQAPRSQAWKDGWNKAIQDYKNGKLKL